MIARFYVNHRFRIPPRSEGWAILIAGVLTWVSGAVEIWRGTIGLGEEWVNVGPMNQSSLKDVSLFHFFCSFFLKKNKENKTQ